MPRRSSKPKPTPRPIERDSTLAVELVDHIEGTACSANEFIERLEAVVDWMNDRLETARDARRDADET